MDRIQRIRKPAAVIKTSSAPDQLTHAQQELANELMRRHGPLRVAWEASGLHFYIASPACLEEDGAIELEKLHLAINVDKFLDEEGSNMVAMCMKTNTRYDVLDLLSMQTLSQRGYEHKLEIVNTPSSNPDYLEDDGRGNMIPKSPGEMVPVFRLPHTHPAQEYLRSRGFNAIRLYQQFRLSYCEKQRDDIFYRKLLNGFRATSQGRLIFYIDIDGLNRGWQARILEKEEGGFKWFFHPYSRKWVKVLRRVEDKLERADTRWENWDPCKYFCGHGTQRNSCLMGYDAAVHWNKTNTPTGGARWCVLVEGPLDAGRIGPPAMAIMGKSFSPDQCALVCRYFSRFIYIQDNDEAGEAAGMQVLKRFAEVGQSGNLTVISAPDRYKDVGEMPEQEAQEMIRKVL